MSLMLIFYLLHIVIHYQCRIGSSICRIYSNFGIVLFAIIYVVMSIFTRVFKQYDKLNNSVQENVRGIRVVKAYVREDF